MSDRSDVLFRRVVLLGLVFAMIGVVPAGAEAGLVEVRISNVELRNVECRSGGRRLGD